jgi:hypothetical protein
MERVLAFLPMHRARGPIGSVGILAVLSALALGSGAATAAQAVTPVLPIVPSIAVEPFTGDVFTIGSNGSLIDVDPRLTPASAPLFNKQGTPLNLTWGAWMAATGTAYAYESPAGEPPATIIAITLKGLIPYGAYSVFYRTFTPDTNNPLCLNVEPSLALHSINPFQQPDRSSFVASSSGDALFVGLVAGHLLDAQQVQYSLIYHFDGKTYGELANQAEAASQPVPPGGTCRSSYGIDAMRQFLIIQK